MIACSSLNVTCVVVECMICFGLAIVGIANFDEERVVACEFVMNMWGCEIQPYLLIFGGSGNLDYSGAQRYSFVVSFECLVHIGRIVHVGCWYFVLGIVHAGCWYFVLGRH